MDAALTPLLLWLAATALIAVGLAGTVLPALPGIPLVFIGLWLGAWIDDYARVGALSLGIIATLGVLAMILDLAASALGAKKVGASPQAITGAMLGSVVGLFFGLPGLIAGPFIGAVLGELSAQRSLEQATVAGVAAWLGLLLGTIAKLALSLAMIGAFAFAYFF